MAKSGIATNMASIAYAIGTGLLRKRSAAPGRVAIPIDVTISTTLTTTTSLISVAASIAERPTAPGPAPQPPAEADWRSLSITLDRV